MARRRLVAAGILVGSLGALTSCARDCPDVAQTLLVRLNDSGGDRVSGRVEYIGTDGLGGSCPEGDEEDVYVCELPHLGPWTIEAASYGFATTEIDSGMPDSWCTNDVFELDVEMEVLDCSGEAVYAAIVTLIDPEGTVEGTPFVYWLSDDEDGFCDEQGNDTYGCASERSGNLTFGVTPDGNYLETRVLAAIEHDGCHPVTQDLDLELERDE